MSTDPGRGPLNPLEQLSLEQLRTRTSAKWTTHPPDVLPLWVAEMDVPLAAPIADRLRRAIDSGDTGYPRPGTGYAEALRSFAVERWGWDGVDVAATALAPDVMVAIVEVLRLITRPGDVVVVCAPVYPPFYAFVSHADRRVVEARLDPAGRLDPVSLETALATARRSCDRPVLLLCNPHNPTGVAHTRAELTAVAALAGRYGARVVADEIHAPLVLPGAEFVPYLSVPGTADAFAVYSASKGWNLAALKAALIVAGPQAAEDLARLPEEVSHLPSHLGVLAQVAAFDHGRPWLDALRTGLVANRDLLVRLVGELLPQLALIPPQATYLGWLDCRRLGLHEEPVAGVLGTTSDLAGPALMFRDRARVALSSGHVFGGGGAGFARINFATSAAVLEQALRQMAAAVDDAGATQAPPSTATIR